MTVQTTSLKANNPKLGELLQRSATSCSMTALQWDTLAEQFGPEIYAEALYRLTRLEMPPQQARDRLLAIVEHQRQLSGSLGRCVNLITATCDYFAQVDPVVREPILLEVNLLKQKEEGAYRDELTGLYNRRAFNQELPREIERFRRFGHPFSLLMLDLDHFKNFNDSHGHSAGDQALRDVARILIETARLYDRVVRYGGEEFAIILPQASAEEALTVAERIRLATRRHTVTHAGRKLGNLTVSIGMAGHPADGLDMDTLVRAADAALYQAKASRDCVRHFKDANRSHPRYALSDPLPLYIQSEELGRLKADAHELSFSGLRCSASAPLPPTTLLRMVLTDPERSIHLPISGEVRRLDQLGDGAYQMGLSFRLERVEDQMKLMTLLDGRTGESDPLSTCGVQDAWA